ncbi:hypothetical protein [Hydrogenophaga sp. IBVHS2]|uniref:hypothetical protein n=1 Tax=Hydrogenophaga sp. IBVHS2 TaxID=1985170 RepID=UPI0015C4EBA0|nr:hypothetical protein [Hydrogenophaga sp. IBVHS2]
MEDPRCCGTGTCIINAEGFCWCGQRWDGEKMCFPAAEPAARTDDDGAEPSAPPAADH